MKKKKAVKPDEYFSHGPIELARFGRFCMMRNNMTKTEFDEFQERLIARFPLVCTEIDTKVAEIVEIIKKASPVDVLKRAYWEMAMHHFNVETESELGHDASVSYRMVDYLQSVITAIPPHTEEHQRLDDQEWNHLRETVDALFSQLNVEYQICRTAISRHENLEYDEGYEEFIFKSQIYWCNVRGQRYLSHEIQFFREVLAPHDAILRELFGIGVEEVVNSLHGIQRSLTQGIADVMVEFDEFRQATLQELEERIKFLETPTEEEIPEIMHQIVLERGWGQWQESILGRLFGEDLFDLQKNSSFPTTLLDALSWERGGDSEFFADGEFRGWPLRVWPIFKRPFLKLNGHYYCFDLHGLFDHFYRALQHVIIHKKPDYKTTWKDKQNIVSEEIPCNLLRKLLPEAKLYRNVYYPITGQEVQRNQWGEADAILIYDDYLFVVEVKGGAFTYTSPATDFPAYIQSLKNLVFKPSEQGKRFLKYLASSDEVTLFDSQHNEITRASRLHFKQAVVLAVTLDPFTEYAAQIQHIKNIGVDIGEAVWSLSVEDLTVYSEIFNNPLIFLHFVEERMRANQSKRLKLDDELYHIGLYLKHNIYTEHVKQFKEDEPVQWVGYAADIDRYFSKKIEGIADATPPEQKIPKRIKEIIYVLTKGSKPGRSRVVRTLLNCNTDWRERINSGIDALLAEQIRDKRIKSISTYVGEKISIYCWQEGFVERKEQFALEHSLAAMMIGGDTERLLIELCFNRTNTIIDIDFKFLSLNTLSGEELKQITSLAETIRKGRIERMKAIRSIGRNDLCPCGSGKKYKKCCLCR